MTASIQSPADLVNNALRRIGYKLRVGNLYDGSFAAKQALDVYAQTRDELLIENDWDFAERNISLNLLKSAPALPDGSYGYIPPNTWNPATNPPLPWLFEYTYPSDSLKVRIVKQVPLFLPNFDPQPHPWAVVNDTTYTPFQRVLVSNLPAASLTYTGQVTDLSTWDVGAVEAFSAALGRRLVPTLMGLNALQPIAQDEQTALAVGEEERG